MKRKLNDHGMPEEVSLEPKSKSPIPGFDSLGLEDHRLLQGIVGQKFSVPTAVQAKAIPFALQGKDILGEIKC